MDIKKLFINFIIVLFVGVVAFSIVTVIKRGNEPKDDYVIPDNTQSVIFDDVSDDTESEAVTEATESTEISETEEEPDVEETRTLYVQGSVNVRSGPGVTHPLVGNLAINAEVTAIGAEVDGWQKIIYRETEAYVSAEYLGETPVEVTPEPEENVEQTPPAQPEVTPTPETTPAPEATPTPEPETTPIPEPTPEPETTPTPEPTPEQTPESEPTPEEPAPSEPPTGEAEQPVVYNKLQGCGLFI